MTEAGMYFQGRGPIFDALRRLQSLCDAAGIAFVAVGGLALNAHGYRRMTEDIDICMRPADFVTFRARLVGVEYQGVADRPRRFFDPVTQVTLDVLLSGDKAGRRDRDHGVVFPDPSECVHVQGLRTISLERLIEMKLATWRLKDWSDVVALIRLRSLPEDFADRLDVPLRTAFKQCFDFACEEERYEREMGGT